MAGPDFSQVVLLLMPTLSSLFIMNFGAQLAEVVTVITTFSAAAAPVILPAVLPWVSTGEIEVTVPLVTSLAGGLFAGGTAAYTSVKRRTFGIKVQGMATGFMITGFTSPLYAGLIRVHLPELVPVMVWALFGISLVQGHILGTLYVKFQHLMTSAFSSLLGAYATLLSVASLGLPFTEGLGLSDFLNGQPSPEELEEQSVEDGVEAFTGSKGSGCTKPECFAVIAATVWYAFWGFTNQRRCEERLFFARSLH
jgi:hypothetical protein